MPLLGTDASEPRRMSGRAAASLCRSTVVMPATRSSRCACSRLARRPPARNWPKRSSTWAPHRLRRLPPERVSRGQEQYLSCRQGGESGKQHHTHQLLRGRARTAGPAPARRRRPAHLECAARTSLARQPSEQPQQVPSADGMHLTAQRGRHMSLRACREAARAHRSSASSGGIASAPE